MLFEDFNGWLNLSIPKADFKTQVNSLMSYDFTFPSKPVWLKQMETRTFFSKVEFRYQKWSVVGLLSLVACLMSNTSAQGQSDNSFAPLGNRGQLPPPKFSHGPSMTPPASRPTPPTKFAPVQTSPRAEAFSSLRGSQSTQANSTSSEDSDNKINVPYCSIEFVDDIMLPALEAGAITTVNVQEGQFITAGTIVGQIDDTLPHYELERAKLRYQNAFKAAKDQTSILAAQKEYELARNVYEKNKRLRNKGSRSESEVMESRFQTEIASLKLDKANNDRQMAFGEAKVELAGMDSVKQRIARHTLRSNYDAYVVDIIKKPQEYVNIGDDVIRLARMDQMWVQASLNAKSLNAADAENRPVTVTLKTANGEQSFEGKIDQVSLENVSAEEYQVKIKVQNRREGNSWMLRPFSQVSMVIHMDRAPITGGNSVSALQAQLPLGN